MSQPQTQTAPVVPILTPGGPPPPAPPGTSATPAGGDDGTGAGDSSDALLCAICIDSASIPIELPCNHIFCYLCIKGVAQQALQQAQTPRCSICRKEISADFLANPRLKDASLLLKNSQRQTDEYQWFYEARRGGWWQFEERLTQDLEKAFEAKEKSCQLLIAGLMYQVDLQQMIQYRVGTPQYARKIKRDLPTSQKKGIAGIRLGGSQGSNSSGSAGVGGSASGTATATPLVQPHVNQAHPNGGPPGAGHAVGPGPPVQNVMAPGPDPDESEDSDPDDDDDDESWDEEYSSTTDEEMDLEESSEDPSSPDSGLRSSPGDIPSRSGARAPTSRSITSSASQVQSPLPGSASSGSGSGPSPSATTAPIGSLKTTSVASPNIASTTTATAPVSMVDDDEIEIL